MTLTYIDAEDVADFVDSHLAQWVKDTVLTDVIRFAQAANMPDQFISHIVLVHGRTKRGVRYELGEGYRTKGRRKYVSLRASYKLENDWIKKDRYGTHALGVFFEYGTKDHMIYPRYAKALRWVERQSRMNPMRNAGKVGQLRFSKGHRITGVPPTMPMTRGMEAGKKRLHALIASEIKNKFSDSEVR